MSDQADLSDVNNVPRHVAIIMDGNGRWAKARGLQRTIGHKQGIESVKRTVKAARQNKVDYLTLFVFSSENWQRSAFEVKELMGLLRFYLQSETAKMHQENIRLRVIGDMESLPNDVADLLTNAVNLTKNNAGFNLIVAVSYGSRQEITHVVQKLAQQVKDGILQPQDITEKTITHNLWTHDVPSPDLIIRTGGDHRLSNFLLWQAAYSELLFSPVSWPDFSENHFQEALKEFARRERRYGQAVETISPGMAHDTIAQ